MMSRGQADRPAMARCLIAIQESADFDGLLPRSMYPRGLAVDIAGALVRVRDVQRRLPMRLALSTPFAAMEVANEARSFKLENRSSA